MSLLLPAATLLHTALALRTPSLDSVVLLSPRLPPEILNEIHSALLASLAASLAASTTAALKDYQRRVKASLCKDCRDYNETIYGPDIWKWDGYKGPCLCRAQQAVWRTAHRRSPWDFIRKFLAPREAPRHTSRRVVPQEDVPVFASRDAWLADHLSRHALCHGCASIWDAVDLALRPYGCRVAPATHTTVAIVADSQDPHDWALRRVVHDLMLSEALPIAPSIRYSECTPSRSALAPRKSFAPAPATVLVGAPRVPGGMHTSTLIPIPYMVACGRALLLLLLALLLSLLLAAAIPLLPN
ncbi:hypothetical protein NEOLEDRAFT_96377 [Neolentinus lepideus HHB14362 ss-1]|uniref:Uncharacterized protein n=1 Tax=Neolentinus lepideus HHB14362 ss-1 TaxID=1314782 RepID=A0A165U2X7_9AGAM|nr:hypothetical protein NEOLEDRAFT_96377 [Neolentinus lepideus HHB14362 ss-1]